jgi:hypothetical protein
MGYHLEAEMTDVLIRDVPEKVVAALDAHATRLGLSRSEYVRPVFAAHPETAHRIGRPSNFSILLRSRLVGRPVPRSRAATATASSRGGGGGLLSI